MSFYSDWENNLNTDQEENYIIDFLNFSSNSLEIFLSGTKDEIFTACKILINTPISKFIATINNECNYTSENILQFSNFDHAVSNVCTCCEIYREGLTFNEIGKMIMHSKLEGACKKYGENHSKLAAELSFVTLTKNGSFYVKNTALGSFTISLTKECKYELIKRLALRNKFIKNIICKAKNGIIYYSSLASKVLSESTVNRSKSNVKFLTMLILENEHIKNNIIW